MAQKNVRHSARMKRMKCIAAASMAAAVLTACSGADETAPDTYEIHKAAMESGGKRENGISDMLPPLSDDTRVISVEEAQKLIPADGDGVSD